jgi:phospholipid N-methyltransferase
MASDFLDNLKKAVDTGEFNSEAAKKIIDIDKLADEKIDPDDLVQKRLDVSGVKTASITEEEVEVINAEYEKKMQEIKEKDLVLQQIKTLQEIDETVMLSIQDMRDFVQTLEESFDKENHIHADMFTEIEKIKNKYNSIINK